MTMPLPRLAALTLLGLAALLPAAPVLAQAGHDHAGHAASPAAGPIMAMQAWARPTTSQAKAGGVFITLHNTGADADTLTAAAAPAVAERTELHTHVMDGGVARMRPVEGGIEIPAGQAVALQPGGLHIMLMGLKAPLKPGDRFPLTLTFAKAGTSQVEVEVLPPGKEPAQAATGTGHSH